jgi:hypothetical protein
VQLIDDIENFKTGKYYLGTLIVHKRSDGKFEVIDGQQRLTALYLLLTALEVPFDSKALSFEYRQKSDDTLSKLQSDEQTNWRQTSDEGILSGFDVALKKLGDKTDNLIRALKKVTLVRVIVPPNTDLNKYFEIMNNRGEQLEQQDIVKSHLLSILPTRTRQDKLRQDAYARIWDACSDMAGYVQMHFDKPERDYYFGWNWQEAPDDETAYYLDEDKSDRTKGRSISEIADSADVTSVGVLSLDKTDEDNIRFESFVTFRHFLLHVLRVFETEEFDGYDYDKEWSGLIDDKKLIERFKEVFPRDDSNSVKAVERFGLCLLRCRFLFDNFILKREFKGDDTEGKWSLKTLKVSWSNTKKYAKRHPKAYYTDVPNSTSTRMLQAMLRVTFTSPLVMHWVTEYLSWLYFNDYDYWEADERLESIARRDVYNWLQSGNYNDGLKTPHIVFNFLDYLLWSEKKISEFQFEFRNSVEHWYPQNPIDSNVKWKKALHHFGNLCLVSSGLNSKFSNNMPAAKKANFSRGIERQSLKLRLMADETINAEAWTEEVAVFHGELMIKKLEEAVYEEEWCCS